MNKMLLLLCLVALSWAQAATPRVVRVAVFPHRSASFQDGDGRVKGF